MELDAMIGIAASIGDKLDEHTKRMSDIMRQPKPLGRTIGGVAIAQAGVVTNVTAQQTCPVGKMWEVHVLGLFGSDTHTAVLNNPVPATPTFPASGTPVPNLNTYPVLVTLTGGTFSAVTINGAGAGLGGTYLLQPGATINITYTVAPTWQWTYDGPAVGAIADIFTGSEQDVNTSDFTSIAASAVTIPFVKDYGNRHICAYPGENVYALVYGAPTNQSLVIIAIVDEWNWSEREMQHV